MADRKLDWSSWDASTVPPPPPDGHDVTLRYEVDETVLFLDYFKIKGVYEVLIDTEDKVVRITLRYASLNKKAPDGAAE